MSRLTDKSRAQEGGTIQQPAFDRRRQTLRTESQFVFVCLCGQQSSLGVYY